MNRLHFCAWLEFYYRIYNIPDGAPPQETIDNDYLLDKWIVRYNQKKRAERTGKGRKNDPEDHPSVIKFGRKD